MPDISAGHVPVWQVLLKWMKNQECFIFLPKGPKNMDVKIIKSLPDFKNFNLHLEKFRVI